MRFTPLLVLLVAAPALATPTIRARYTVPTADVATLTVLQDATVVLADAIPGQVDCGASKCSTPFALPPRGLTVTYTLRACNTLGECAVSNGVPFRAPLQPTAPTLSFEIMP